MQQDSDPKQNDYQRESRESATLIDLLIPGETPSSGGGGESYESLSRDQVTEMQQARKEEARTRRRKKKKTNSSLLATTFQELYHLTGEILGQVRI